MVDLYLPQYNQLWETQSCLSLGCISQNPNFFLLENHTSDLFMSRNEGSPESHVGTWVCSRRPQVKKSSRDPVSEKFRWIVRITSYSQKKGGVRDLLKTNQVGTWLGTPISPIHKTNRSRSSLQVRTPSSSFPYYSRDKLDIFYVREILSLNRDNKFMSVPL